MSLQGRQLSRRPADSELVDLSGNFFSFQKQQYNCAGLDEDPKGRVPLREKLCKLRSPRATPPCPIQLLQSGYSDIRFAHFFLPPPLGDSRIKAAGQIQMEE